MLHPLDVSDHCDSIVMSEPETSPGDRIGNGILAKTSHSSPGQAETNLAFIHEDDEDRDPNKEEDKDRAASPSKSSTFAESRTSSAEKTFRQATNRTIRRVSRAFSSVGLFPSEIKLVGITEEELLGKLFDAFDYYREGKLNQDKWIDFLKVRLHQFNVTYQCKAPFEDRKNDFVEVVESVSYAVCGPSDLTFETFCTVFRTKNVLNKLYRLIDRDLDGVVNVDQIMEFISQLSGARCGSRLTKDNIAYLERLFRQYVGDGKEITKSDFSQIIQTKNQFFTDRVFDIFDDDANGSISLQEFLDAMHKFTGENPEDKIRFLFKVYDVSGDGLIQEVELEQVMRACMEENGMKFSDEQIHELTTALFEDADVERRGALTYDALKAQLEKHSGLLENLSISIERWLVPVKPVEAQRKSSLMSKLRSLIPHQCSFGYLKNNYVFVTWLMAFIVTNVTLFVTRAAFFSGSNPCATIWLILAKSSGQALNFNCSYILVLILKKCLTFLRARGASKFLPIDQNIYFHKLAGYFIVGHGLLHSVAHFINIEVGFIQNPAQNIDCSEVDVRNWTYAEYLFLPGASLPFGLIPGFAFNTGVFILLILSVMFVCSLPFVRRGGYFQVFHWTHLLYILFWALLVIHAPNFWIWFIVPAIVFCFEQGVRIYRWKLGSGKTFISSGILLPSKVTHLIIRRPKNFSFQPGDYVFVRIPAIAKYEWHPFTISSSPEQEDAIWLHVRAVGEWTNRLYEYFEQEQSNMNPIIWDFRSKTDAFTKGFKYKKKETVRRFSRNTLTGSLNRRLQLMSVADSVTSCAPESNHSSSVNASPDDVVTVTSSEDVLERIGPINQVSGSRKIPLEKMHSFPNVSEKIPSKENNRKRLARSESNSDRNLVRSKTSSGRYRAGSVDSSINLSHRYLRYKPTIINFETPNEEESDMSLRESLLPNARNKSVRISNSPESIAEQGQVEPSQILEPGRLESDAACYGLGTTWISREESPAGKALEIFIDGPLGAPSSHIFRAEHAVLIATGIGVTPFASILQSIMRRYWASRNTCPNCSYTWCNELPESVLNLKKVDFFWINRDQRSFEWFVHLLSQLEIEQAELGGAMERFLDMHMFITSALQKTDMKAVGLQLALDLLHEKEKRDLITGLKTRTNAGRPNWSKIFKQIQVQEKGKVTVFYCGPPALARTLKFKCDEFGFSFRKEVF